MSAEHGAQRFRVGEVPPLAEGYTDRPDTARGILDALVPRSALALVPGSAFAEGPSNWLGACGKTQIAVIVAESLWRSTAIDALIWISATSRESVLSSYVEASAAAFGIAPTGTAESVAARLVSWLATTDQRWMIVLDDLQDQTDLDGLWPEGPSGRVLVTSMQASLTSGRRGIQVIPVGFFSIREALNCLTERLSVNPVQRHGAIDLIEALGREPLALAQAASVVANSTLACRDYRDYFARRRQQIGVAAGEVPSAAAVTWTLSLGQAESLLPGASVRLMLVLVALFDGHGVPGAVFSTSAVSAYLGGAATPFSAAALRLNTAALHDAAPDVLWADGCHPVLLRAGRSLDDARLVGPAVEYWRDLSARCDTKLMPGHPDALVVAAYLAAAYLAAGYASEAVHWYQRVLAERGRELAPGHPAIIAARVNLAKALILAGEPADAVTVLQRAVSECEQFRGPGHPDTLSARHELAEAYQVAGDAKTAIRLLSKNLADRDRLQGPRDAETMATRDRLAAAFLAEGNNKDA